MFTCIIRNNFQLVNDYYTWFNRDKTVDKMACLWAYNIRTGCGLRTHNPLNKNREQKPLHHQNETKVYSLFVLIDAICFQVMSGVDRYFVYFSFLGAGNQFGMPDWVFGLKKDQNQLYNFCFNGGDTPRIEITIKVYLSPNFFFDM